MESDTDGVPAAETKLTHELSVHRRKCANAFTMEQLIEPILRALHLHFNTTWRRDES
jgi:hypothetical protein